MKDVKMWYTIHYSVFKDGVPVGSFEVQTSEPNKEEDKEKFFSEHNPHWNDKFETITFK